MRSTLIIIAISSTIVLAHPTYSLGFTKQQSAQGQSGEEQERRLKTLTDEEVNRFLDKFAGPERLPYLLEAERRGILPPDKLEALQEARKRGLLEPYLAASSSTKGKVEAGPKPSSTEPAGKLFTTKEIDVIGSTVVFVVALGIYIFAVFFLIPKQLLKRLGSKRYVSLYWWGLCATILGLVFFTAGYHGLTKRWSTKVPMYPRRAIVRRSQRYYTKSTPRYELFLVPVAGGLLCVAIARILELAREKEKEEGGDLT